MRKLDSEYIDLKLESEKIKAKLNVINEGLIELRKNLIEIYDTTNDISEDEYSNILDDIMTLMHTCDIDNFKQVV